MQHSDISAATFSFKLKAVKMIKSLKSTICDERLRGAGLFSLEKRRLKESMITVFKFVKGRCKEEGDEPLLVSYLGF